MDPSPIALAIVSTLFTLHQIITLPARLRACGSDPATHDKEVTVNSPETNPPMLLADLLHRLTGYLQHMGSTAPINIVVQKGTEDHIYRISEVGMSRDISGNPVLHILSKP